MSRGMPVEDPMATCTKGSRGKKKTTAPNPANANQQPAQTEEEDSEIQLPCFIRVDQPERYANVTKHCPAGNTYKGTRRLKYEIEPHRVPKHCDLADNRCCCSEHLKRVHAYAGEAMAEADDETSPTRMSKATHDRWKKCKKEPRPKESNGNVPIGNAMKLWRALNLTKMPDLRT